MRFSLNLHASKTNACSFFTSIAELHTLEATHKVEVWMKLSTTASPNPPSPPLYFGGGEVSGDEQQSKMGEKLALLINSAARGLLVGLPLLTKKLFTRE